MATNAQLSAKVDELQASLDAEQAQIQSVIEGQAEIITQLQALVAEGGTAEERQAILDKMVALQADLEGTVNPPTPPPSSGPATPSSGGQEV